MRVIALRHLVEKDRGYKPGDVIAEGSDLYNQRDYYARVGMVRVEDPLVSSIEKVVISASEIPADALAKAREAAAKILGGETTPKRGRPKKVGEGVAVDTPLPDEGDDEE